VHEVDRTRRVAEVIRRELATLIAREISDPRLKSVSLNTVKVSRDLKNARIYFSTLDTPYQSVKEAEVAGQPIPADVKPGASVEQVLNNAAGYLRKLLSQNAGFRVTPHLRFKYDDSIKRGVEMSSLIESLVNKNGRDTDGS